MPRQMFILLTWSSKRGKSRCVRDLTASTGIHSLSFKMRSHIEELKGRRVPELGGACRDERCCKGDWIRAAFVFCVPRVRSRRTFAFPGVSSLLCISCRPLRTLLLCARPGGPRRSALRAML
eukprot:scaffold1021_cov108-Isochrysis_galbana.AAC.17